MPVSKEYRESIESIIAGVVPIRTKAMFGGIAIYSEELLFSILDNDRIWFKTDETNQSDFENKGCEQWRPVPSAPPMGYFELPAGILEDANELEVWIHKSMHVAERKAASKKPKKKKA